MILALDASTTAIGYAYLTDDDSPHDLAQWGCYRPSGELWDRLVDGGHWLKNWLAQHGPPPFVAIELPVVGVNTRTAMKQARMVGVLGAIAYSYGCEIVEVNPTERLSAIGLKSNADKADVVRTVNAIYGLSLRIRENDTADAIAIAWAARRIVERESDERISNH